MCISHAEYTRLREHIDENESWPDAAVLVPLGFAVVSNLIGIGIYYLIVKEVAFNIFTFGLGAGIFCLFILGIIVIVVCFSCVISSVIESAKNSSTNTVFVNYEEPTKVEIIV